jgi:hypothetical protein
MNYISLGPTCSVAYQLQKLNLKKESLPFDWIRCNSISFLLNLIKNNFNNFFDDLTYVKDDTKFPYIEKDDSVELFDEIKDFKTKIYKTKNIGFFHDFKEDVTIDQIKEKYNRRIKRFYETIKNKSIFIRDDLFFKESNIPVYNELNNLLKNFNKDNLLVLIINTNKNLNLSSLDKSIKIYIDSEKITEWQHPSIQLFIKDLHLNYR